MVQVAASLVVAKAGKEESEERAALMARLRQLQAQAQQQAAELGAYRASDPEAVEAMRQGRVAARDAANRWLDNTYNLLSWCKRQFPGERKAPCCKHPRERVAPAWRRAGATQLAAAVTHGAA